MTSKTYTLLYEYRFLMLDFVRIMRRIKSVREHYQQLTESRKGQFLFLTHLLQQNGIIKADLSDDETADWIALATLFSDFWLSNAAILYEGKEEDKVLHYVHLFMRLGSAYMTKQGAAELNAILK